MSGQSNGLGAVARGGSVPAGKVQLPTYISNSVLEGGLMWLGDGECKANLTVLSAYGHSKSVLSIKEFAEGLQRHANMSGYQLTMQLPNGTKEGTKIVFNPQGNPGKALGQIAAWAKTLKPANQGPVAQVGEGSPNEASKGTGSEVSQESGSAVIDGLIAAANVAYGAKSAVGNVGKSAYNAATAPTDWEINARRVFTKKPE